MARARHQEQLRQAWPFLGDSTADPVSVSWFDMAVPVAVIWLRRPVMASEQMDAQIDLHWGCRSKMVKAIMNDQPPLTHHKTEISL